MLESNAQITLARESLILLKSTEDALLDRFQSGQNDSGSIGTELRLAASDSASAKANVANLLSQKQTLERQLQILLGQYPDGLLPVSIGFPNLPPSPPAGLPSTLLLRRPDILASAAAYEASIARNREARLAAFPTLNLSGNLGRSSSDISDILRSDFGVWSLAGNILQPILAGGAIRAEMIRRKSVSHEAFESLRQTVLTSFAEVEIALNNEYLLAEQENALRERVQLATDADEQARASYRDGSVDIFTVLDTQSRFIDSRSRLIKAQNARLQNRIDLHLALGGDYKLHSKSTTDTAMHSSPPSKSYELVE